MQEHKKSYSKRNTLLALLLLLAANIVMGLVLVMQSRAALREQINQRMLDISNTAAYMLDGDVMKALTDDDVGTPEYEESMGILRSFQQNIDLEYIYAINREADGSFTFSIDPTVDDPGEFGSPIVKTEALVIAANGTPAVDKKAFKDEWGRFYSAYSPVFDSDGRVACVVAVDFAASWIEKQVAKNVITIVIITAIMFAIGIYLSVKISQRYRRRFHALDAEMGTLEEQFKELDNEMKKGAVKKLYLMPDSAQKDVLTTLAAGETYTDEEGNDEFAAIDKSLHTMAEDLKRYINYVHSQAYIDPMTGIGNRLAYKEAVEKADEAIKADIDSGSDEYLLAVGFFDINGLQRINAQYGFAAGDEILFAAATVLRNTYGHRKVFRIASDEFIVVMEGKGLLDMDKYWAQLVIAIRAFNQGREGKPQLNFSKGVGVYRKGNAKSYREVFIRAEENGKREKQLYYKALEKELEAKAEAEKNEEE